MGNYYRAKHILLQESDDVEYIKNCLESGTSFEELAQEFSECETADLGGDLGRFRSGSMIAEFEKALYQMAVGEVAYGIKTKYGYHIIWRLE